MLFNSIDFAIFLPIVFVLYWFVTTKSLKLQNILIVVASYVFYGWWDWRFLSLLLFSTLVDYVIGRLQIREQNEEYFLNENAFQQLVKQRYSGVVFLDFSNFYLPDSCYKDYRHLNYYGSLVFSKKFNNFISDSLIN